MTLANVALAVHLIVGACLLGAALLFSERVRSFLLGGIAIWFSVLYMGLLWLGPDLVYRLLVPYTLVFVVWWTAWGHRNFFRDKTPEPPAFLRASASRR